MFKAEHSGVSNPSLGLSYRVIGSNKVTFVVHFILTVAFYGLVKF